MHVQCVNDIEANIEGDEDVPLSPPALCTSISAPVSGSGRAQDERPIPLVKASSDPLLNKKTHWNKTNARQYNDITTNWFRTMPIPPALLSRISSSGTSSTFHCAICLENHPFSESFTMIACDMSHTFCKNGMMMYLTSQITDGILTFKCPMYGQCEGIMCEDEIEALLGEEVLQKYLRFKKMKNTDYRECPDCSQSVIASAESPEITCTKCGIQYCYFHANAHPDVSCAEYTRKNLRAELKSNAFISSITLKCPTCRVDTEKSGGCNHIKCHHCQQDWCWLCGQAIESTPEAHYKLGSLCYGGLLTPTPTWSCWAMCPISRHTLFLCFNLLQFPMVITVLAIAFAVCLIGLGVAISCIPLELIWILMKLTCLMSKCGGTIEQRDFALLLYPALGVMCVLSGILFICVELIWVWFVILWLIGMYCGKALGFRNDTSGLFGGNGDRTMEVWCFPIVFSLLVIVPVGKALGLKL